MSASVMLSEVICLVLGCTSTAAIVSFSCAFIALFVLDGVFVA